jgi:antimicrobial peptide system SdpB family protein
MLYSRSVSAVWTNVAGAARSTLALASFMTLLVNPAPVWTSGHSGLLTGALQSFGLFNLFGPAGIDRARMVGMLVLLVVASGWRPRLTAIPHWWVTASIAHSCLVPDGGDVLSANLTLLLIPLALTDSRRFHWQASSESGGEGSLRLFLARTAGISLRIQVAAVYLHAAAGKMNITEWINGTAMHYWLVHPAFGPGSGLKRFMVAVLAHPFAVLGLTWSVILLELFLFGALFMPRDWRYRLWPVAVGFHLMIFAIHGLASFSLIMVAAATLYLVPLDTEWYLVRRRALTRSLAEPNLEHSPVPEV